MSVFTRPSQPATQEPAAPEAGLLPADSPAPTPTESSAAEVRRPTAPRGPRRDDGAPAGRRAADWRTVAGRVLTVLAALFVLFALVVPDNLSELTPGTFLRIPVEALLGVALAAVLPARPRRVLAVLAGVALGLLTIVKILDMGFYAVLDRPFDLVLDWILLDDSRGVLGDSIGRAARTRWRSRPSCWCSVLIVLHDARDAAAGQAGRPARRRPRCRRWRCSRSSGSPAPRSARSSCRACRSRPTARHPGLRPRPARWARPAGRRRRFAEELAPSTRSAPRRASSCSPACGARTSCFAFIESYGRDAIEDPEMAPQVDAVLDAGTRRLNAAGYSSRSAFLTSSTAGSGSWLAHATLLSGLWVNNQQRYRTLVASDRLTLTSAFQRAGWRTVGVMPGVTEAWPEGEFFGYDQVYDSGHLGYRGPRFSYATMPDQYTLSAFERLERAKKDRAPLMAEIPLVSSHAPWTPLPRMIDWNDVGDGSVYRLDGVRPGHRPEYVLNRDPKEVRAEYRQSIEYSLDSLISVRGEVRRQEPRARLPRRPPARPDRGRPERQPRRADHDRRPRPGRAGQDLRLGLAGRPEARTRRPRSGGWTPSATAS